MMCSILFRIKTKRFYYARQGPLVICQSAVVARKVICLAHSVFVSFVGALKKAEEAHSWYRPIILQNSFKLPHYYDPMNLVGPLAYCNFFTTFLQLFYNFFIVSRLRNFFITFFYLFYLTFS